MQSPQELNQLLLWLAGDLNAGAKKYEEVRRNLCTFFRYRGCSDPEGLADVTLDRAASNLAKPGFLPPVEPLAYLRGIARNVTLEDHRRTRRFNPDALEDHPEPSAALDLDVQETERLHACLDRCLNRLPAEKRALLLDYYRSNGAPKIEQRQQMARDSGSNLNALRIQLFRLRKIVRSCVESCLRG